MNDLDSLDRRILAALSVNGRASWTDIAQVIGTSTTTVARRAQQLIGDGVVSVAVLPHLEHNGPVEVFLVRLGCAPGSQARVAGELARRPEVGFLALVTGGHDIVFELVAAKDRDLYGALVEDVQRVPGALQGHADLVLHTYDTGRDWPLEALGADAARLAPPRVPHSCDATHLDEVDRDILGVMGEDGRASFQSVAKRLGVSESTVRRRFEAMTERGCASVTTFVPAPALGYATEVLFWLSVEPSRLERAAEALAARREVRRVSATLGQSSLMCEVALPATADARRFTGRTLAGIAGVRSWTASVQILTVKRGFLTAPWAERRLARETAAAS